MILKTTITKEDLVALLTREETNKITDVSLDTIRDITLMMCKHVLNYPVHENAYILSNLLSGNFGGDYKIYYHGAYLKFDDDVLYVIDYFNLNDDHCKYYDLNDEQVSGVDYMLKHVIAAGIQWANKCDQIKSIYSNSNIFENMGDRLINKKIPIPTPYIVHETYRDLRNINLDKFKNNRGNYINRKNKRARRSLDASVDCFKNLSLD